MLSLRNVAFLLLLGTLLGSSRVGAASLLTPQFDCPSGCECNEVEFHEVTIYCEEESGIYVCPDIWTACDDYCEDWSFYYWVEYQLNVSCDADLPGDGCWPTSIEPPTEETCLCTCWY